MLSFFQSQATATLAAFDRSFAMIEFDPNGTILKANANFLAALGYDASEVIGKHHRLFVDEAYAASGDYKSFWNRLASGEANAGEFRRRGKGGKHVWIQASYCPVVDKRGRVRSVVKLAADTTRAKLASMENQSILDAVSKSQGIISFTPTGEIIEANDNFLTSMGYARNEIVGQHHRMFMDPAEAALPDYKRFWERLAKGEFISQEFRRIGKGGKEVLIQAAYNPVMDVEGRVVKVTKMVFDLTERMASINRLGDALTVRRQGFSDNRVSRLVESLAHLVEFQAA